MSNTKSCGECPLVDVGRRTFLRNAALATAATMVALGFAPGEAFAEAVRTVTPGGVTGANLTYKIPVADGVAIDAANEVILVRWQGQGYAFSLACPHRGARLEWHADEQRVFCPKHKARFRPDGVHDSGRQSRNLDRYEIRRDGAALIVAHDRVYQVDTNPTAWAAAVVPLA